ncbi:MAG TPA: HIT family hydrolase [Phycisphaerales bacterium]|nr:HIT family hydrolase [Phycisphaerales bacterium]
MPAGADPNTPSDHTQSISAPWRLSYMELLGAESAAPKPGGAPAKGSCFLRDNWLNPAGDEKNHVIVRTGTEALGRGGMILLNKYPYSNGHLLVCLGEGRPRLLDYDERRRGELWSLVDLAVDLCERALRPQGVNVGVNQGAAAGAGVPEHVHVHVVPRWAGDVNFTSVCAQVRVIPSALEDMARRYREAWTRLRPTRESR